MPKRIFMSRLTVRRRLQILAGVAIAVSLAIAGVALVSSDYSSRILTRQNEISAMMNNHKAMDSRHDSLRAYVLLAIREAERAKNSNAAPAASTSDAASTAATTPAEGEAAESMSLQDIQGEYKDHRDELYSTFGENRKLATELNFDEAAKILDDIKPLLDESAAASGEIVLGNFDDLQAANEQAAKYLVIFKQPEALMDKLADMLDGKLEESRADSASVVTMTRWVLIVACAVGALLILLIAVATFRSVIHPLAAFTAAIRRLADSNHGGDIPGLDRSDEIREMAVALATLRDVSIEAARAMSVLENSTANIMVADTDGKIVFMLERHQIEGRDPQAIAKDLTDAFDRVCAPVSKI